MICKNTVRMWSWRRCLLPKGTARLLLITQGFVNEGLISHLLRVSRSAEKVARVAEETFPAGPEKISATPCVFGELGSPARPLDSRIASDLKLSLASSILHGDGKEQVGRSAKDDSLPVTICSTGPRKLNPWAICCAAREGAGGLQQRLQLPERTRGWGFITQQYFAAPRSPRC